MIKVKIVNKTKEPQLPLPKYMSVGANAFDLSSDEDILIKEGETQVVDTGLIFDLPQDLALRIISRSGLSIKGIVVKNSPALVDTDFRGTVKVILHNTNFITQDAINDFQVKRGDRVAQGYFQYMPQSEMIEISEEHLTQTERGEKGLGSSGV